MSTTDPFDALGLAARFDVDDADVRRAWLKASARLHPDRTTLDPDDAAAQLATINDAKRALEDPERRADAMLARLGGPGKGAERGLPDGFLEQMLDIRTRMEQAQAASDTTVLAELGTWAHAERERFVERVGTLFQDADAAALRSIRLELNAWRYIERMIEQLDPDHDDGVPA
ncbi:MAG: DnaJ domain-containing protein [Planctomycetota bacterium]